MRPSRRPAVIRGFAAASTATFVALAAHVTAGGAMPGTLGILVPWMLSLMVCVLLAGRKLSALRLSVSVLVSQFLFHVLFVLGLLTPTGITGGHVHGAPLQLPETTGLTVQVIADGGMWIGHAAAALLTILALHRGERMLLGMRDLAVQAVRWLRSRLDDATPAARPRATAPHCASQAEESLPAAPFLSLLRGRAPPLHPAI
ncbi:hypothetical protein DY023_16125 [Microbacterium bovistercoris]|uniref:Uncharacterized protein n=1 Tax=Microbacterium bovistercoris TaxID=2293570 RepID=A0A371NNT9_9MICO|nr:hypothetical protein [Microbacterium bovistercoris]REJ03853.1 hypothetical protein DY023_16125 [Microbacterium bovistercoris]